MQIMYQNEALDISLSGKLVSMSFEVTCGQKSRRKGQISIFFRSKKIILKYKALELTSQKTSSRGQ